MLKRKVTGVCNGTFYCNVELGKAQNLHLTVFLHVSHVETLFIWHDSEKTKSGGFSSLDYDALLAHSFSSLWPIWALNPSNPLYCSSVSGFVRHICLGYGGWVRERARQTMRASRGKRRIWQDINTSQNITRSTINMPTPGLLSSFYVK